MSSSAAPKMTNFRLCNVAAVVLVSLLLYLFSRNNNKGVAGANDISPPSHHPHKSSKASLRAEFRRLREGMKKVEQGVESLKKHLHNEPQPPKVDSFTLKTRAPRAVLLANGTLVHGSPNASDTKKQHVGGQHMGRDRSIYDTIFASIASFRDPECEETVLDMYKQAVNPQRVFVGAVEQHDPEGDYRCIPKEFLEPDCAGFPAKYRGFCPIDNIRHRLILPSAAKGPTFGRAIGQYMYRDEKYFMLIDSHNHFLRHWDSNLIRQVLMMPTKGALSQYPTSWFNTSVQDVSVSGTTVMCNAKFLPALGYLRMKGRVLKKTGRLRIQPYSAGGFIFADGALVREVPFDPYLDFIFDGEEILYSVRMWTHGWDMYAPTESVLLHNYARHTAKRIWHEPIPAQTREAKISQQRCQYILGATFINTTIPLVKGSEHPRIKKELDIYGLGKARSLDAYWRFAKVDPVHQIAGDEFCDALAEEDRHRGL